MGCAATGIICNTSCTVYCSHLLPCHLLPPFLSAFAVASQSVSVENRLRVLFGRSYHAPLDHEQEQLVTGNALTGARGHEPVSLPPFSLGAG